MRIRSSPSSVSHSCILSWILFSWHLPLPGRTSGTKLGSPATLHWAGPRGLPEEPVGREANSPDQMRGGQQPIEGFNVIGSARNRDRPTCKGKEGKAPPPQTKSVPVAQGDSKWTSPIQRPAHPIGQGAQAWTYIPPAPRPNLHATAGPTHLLHPFLSRSGVALVPCRPSHTLRILGRLPPLIPLR